MDANRVNVRIYGQDYVISGEQSSEHIIRVADYVDAKMKESARSISPSSTSALAVLAAVNAADDYYGLLEGDAELKDENARLKADVQQYIRLWEEAKKNFLQYKEDSRNALQKMENMEEELSAKDSEIKELKEKSKDLEEKLLAVTRQKAEAENAKLKELESTYFDLEMENVRMKAEIERLKKAQRGF